MSEKHAINDNDAPLESPRARVLNWLKRSLESGEIAAGSEIPAAHAIGRRLGVATNTAAAALDEAENLGLIVQHEGSRKRYAGNARKVGVSFASSMIYVLARLAMYDNIRTAPGWSDAYLALDVVRQLSRKGRHVSLVNAATLSPGDLDAIFAERPAGLVATSCVNGDETSMRALARCREEGIPAVAYGNAPDLRTFDRAYSDHRAGSRDLTRWLVARGRRRIVPFFPAAPSHFWERERIAGYEEAMCEAGLNPAPCMIFGSPKLGAEQTEETFRLFSALAISTLLASKREKAQPDALLCLNDDWAKPVLAAIHDLGLDPDRDIIVAGYDNMPHGTGFDAFSRERPVVTVDKHNERTSRDMVELLLARMEGKLPPGPQARIHAHEVVEVGQCFSKELEP